MINTFRVLKMGEGALQNNTGSRPSLPLPPSASSLLNNPEVPGLGLRQLALRIPSAPGSSSE